MGNGFDRGVGREEYFVVKRELKQSYLMSVSLIFCWIE